MDNFKNDPKEIKFGMLIGNIGRLHATLADQYMERIGLYRGQAMLLLILSVQDGLTHSDRGKVGGFPSGSHEGGQTHGSIELCAPPAGS